MKLKWLFRKYWSQQLFLGLVNGGHATFWHRLRPCLGLFIINLIIIIVLQGFFRFLVFFRASSKFWSADKRIRNNRSIRRDSHFFSSTIRTWYDKSRLQSWYDDLHDTTYALSRVLAWWDAWHNTYFRVFLWQHDIEMWHLLMLPFYTNYGTSVTIALK